MQYLGECLDSVLDQTLPFDKIIIVDDGSTDNSPTIIQNYANKYPQIIPLIKDNAGQLSSFNAAVDLIDEDSQVFFIDCDDLYPLDYHQTIKSQLGENWDISFCKVINFKDSNEIKTAKISNAPPFCLNKSSAIIRKTLAWLGAPTTGISISGGLYKKIIPYPAEQDFLTRADDVFVYASSIVGSKKYFLSSIQVYWREHQANNTMIHQGKSWADRHHNILKPLSNYYCKKFSLHQNQTIFEVLDEFNALSDEEKKFIGTSIPHLFEA
jgi:glycosyltransferase involved in cell wall biosynthesis